MFKIKNLAYGYAMEKFHMLEEIILEDVSDTDLRSVEQFVRNMEGRTKLVGLLFANDVCGDLTIFAMATPSVAKAIKKADDAYPTDSEKVKKEKRGEDPRDDETKKEWGLR